MKKIYCSGVKLLLKLLVLRIIIGSVLSTLYTFEFFTFYFALFFLSVENFLYNLLPNLILVLFLAISTIYIHKNNTLKLALYILSIQFIIVLCGYYFMEDFQILFKPKVTILEIIEMSYFSGYRFLTMFVTYTLFVIIFYYKIDLPYQKQLNLPN